MTLQNIKLNQTLRNSFRNLTNKKDIVLTDTILYKQDTQCTYALPLLVKLRLSVKQKATKVAIYLFFPKSKCIAG